MFVCDVDYCDFSVCTFSEDGEDDYFQERVRKNAELWEGCVSKSKHFFKTAILPELMGKWYTKSNKIYAVSFEVNLNQKDSQDCATSEKIEYCYCKGPDEGNMIGCDNPECSIEWFHWDCLSIKSTPKGKWFCPDCRKLPQFIKKRKTKTL